MEAPGPITSPIRRLRGEMNADYLGRFGAVRIQVYPCHPNGHRILFGADAPVPASIGVKPYSSGSLAHDYEIKR